MMSQRGSKGFFQCNLLKIFKRYQNFSSIYTSTDGTGFFRNKRPALFQQHKCILKRTRCYLPIVSIFF